MIILLSCLFCVNTPVYLLSFKYSLSFKEKINSELDEDTVSAAGLCQQSR